MPLLAGKIIFLTGGSRGIGLECAKKYIEAGAKVAIVADDCDSVSESLKELGDENMGLVADVRSASDIEKAITKTLDKYGKIDVIHNNAGIAGVSKQLHETAEEDWEDLFGINLKGIFYTAKFGLEALKQSAGCILNTSSLVAEIGQENHAVYSATKGAVNALTKSMALDYAPFGIRVNAIAPAGVWTPMLREWSREQPDIKGIEQYLHAIHPLGYCPEGDVIADACVFLVSHKARFMTGNIMPVSGGAELGYRRLG